MAARGLGKGLDSLIPNALGETKTKKEAVAKAKSEAITEEKEPQTLVKITKVEPNREQPRKNFDEDAITGTGGFYQTVWSVAADSGTGS